MHSRSSDSPDMFATMEKDKMYIFRGVNPEEPINSQGYMCSFNELSIFTVVLDLLLVEPDHPDRDAVSSYLHIVILRC